MTEKKQPGDDSDLDAMMESCFLSDILAPDRRTRRKGGTAVPREPLKKWERGEQFLAGCPRCEELFQAVELGRDTVRLYLCLCQVRGVTKSEYVRPTLADYDFWGIDSPRRYRALKSLEDAGLVCVIRRKGSLPMVRMVWRDLPAQDISGESFLTGVVTGDQPA